MILEKLGIFGISEAAENAVFASLLLGEASLLIGPPGCAKTGMIEAIGAALRESSKRKNPKDPTKWFSYQLYDASKLNFEDMFGYPNLNDMKKDPPQITFVRTPCTIWDKDLIAFDELNRCAEDRQANLLEVIRSRRLQGVDTNNRAVFCTINPLGDVGTVPMGDALVDRQLFYIRFEDFHKMNHKLRKDVINRIGASDSPGLRHWGTLKGDFDTNDNEINTKLADAGDIINDIMNAAAQHFVELKEQVGPAITELNSRLVESFAKEFEKESDKVKKETSISGRRAGSLYRGILAVRAIQLAKTKYGYELETLLPTIINTIKLALPIGIAGNADASLLTRVNNLADTLVKSLWSSISKNKSSADIDALTTALNTNNPVKILNIILTTTLTKVTRDKIMGRLLDEKNYQHEGRTDTTAFNTTKVLLHCLNQKLPGFLPPNINLGVTPDMITTIGSQREVSLPAPLEKHADMIQSIFNSAESSITDKNMDAIVFTGIKLTLPYYSDRITTDSEAITAIIDLKETINALKTAISENANSNQPPATPSK